MNIRIYHPLLQVKKDVQEFNLNQIYIIPKITDPIVHLTQIISINDYKNENIFEYKLIITNKSVIKGKHIIYPFINMAPINEKNLCNENIFNLNLLIDSNNKNNNINNSSNSNEHKSNILVKNIENHFSLNNPHLPEAITNLKLNEDHNILIATTIKNLIYIISLSSNFKLLHSVDYLYKMPKKIKDIIPLSFNGDFIIYTSLNVYLFNINGVPLCELNLLNKENDNIKKIKHACACFIYDVSLFTAHEDGKVILWKVKTKNLFEDFDERISYIYNNNTTKTFLSEYNYNYDLFYFESNKKSGFSEKNISSEYELRRKFDVVSVIIIDPKLISSINYIQLSQNMDYMTIIDEQMRIYILSNFKDYNADNQDNNKKKLNKNEEICIWCKKSDQFEYFRASNVTSIINYNPLELDITKIPEYKSKSISEEYFNKILERNSLEITLKNNDDHYYLCQDCKQRLLHTENYLYNY